MGETFPFRGFDIPVDLCLLTGGGPDAFEILADQHIRNINSQRPLKPGLRVFELGCGIGRDAIQIAEIIGPTGSYVGVDIMEPSIAWCRENITARFPHAQFIHQDVADLLHNPDGTVPVSDIRLPVGDGAVDLVIAQSVLTHMLETELTHYLKEFARILAPDGVVYATCFHVDDEILASVRARTDPGFDLHFFHEVGDGCYVKELDFMTGGVAYTSVAIARMVDAAGLTMIGEIRPGAWCDHHPLAFDGQDVLVLRRA